MQCANCGTEIEEGQPHGVCGNCGNVFCIECYERKTCPKCGYAG